MDAHYILTCGILWRKMADPEAGWGLVEALECPDPNVRSLAQALLVDAEETSMSLLESAVAAGVISPDAAGPCMAEIIRSRQTRVENAYLLRHDLFDLALC